MRTFSHIAFLGNKASILANISNSEGINIKLRSSGMAHFLNPLLYAESVFFFSLAICVTDGKWQERTKGQLTV